MLSALVLNNLGHTARDRALLSEVSFSIAPGEVFGLLGENGAGKTTLIKHCLGLLRPGSGSVTVLGLDPVRDRVALLRQIGYVSEDRDLPMWMDLDEVIWYTSSFYDTWDSAWASELRERFELPPRARLCSLSRGELAKVCLLLALAHRPALLLLDEPSSGLDPNVRKQILEAILHAVAQEGRSVLFSSHLLDEVERLSDRVAILRRGRISALGTVDELKASHRCWSVHFSRPLSIPPAPLISLGGSGTDWTLLCQRGAEIKTSAVLNELGGRIVQDEPASLEQIFSAESKISSYATD